MPREIHLPIDAKVEIKRISLFTPEYLNFPLLWIYE